jgi:hypothetical protein
MKRFHSACAALLFACCAIFPASATVVLDAAGSRTRNLVDDDPRIWPDRQLDAAAVWSTFGLII